MEGMAIVKMIEVLAQSEKSWEDAAQEALRQASRTVRNIRSLHVQGMQLVLNDGAPQYRIDAKICFEAEPLAHPAGRIEARAGARRAP